MPPQWGSRQAPRGLLHLSHGHSELFIHPSSTKLTRAAGTESYNVDAQRILRTSAHGGISASARKVSHHKSCSREMLPGSRIFCESASKQARKKWNKKIFLLFKCLDRQNHFEIGLQRSFSLRFIEPLITGTSFRCQAFTTRTSSCQCQAFAPPRCAKILAKSEVSRSSRIVCTFCTVSTKHWQKGAAPCLYKVYRAPLPAKALKF